MFKFYGKELRVGAFYGKELRVGAIYRVSLSHGTSMVNLSTIHPTDSMSLTVEQIGKNNPCF
jgi:hypothetical protein